MCGATLSKMQQWGGQEAPHLLIAQLAWQLAVGYKLLRYLELALQPPLSTLAPPLHDSEGEPPLPLSNTTLLKWSLYGCCYACLQCHALFITQYKWLCNGKTTNNNYKLEHCRLPVSTFLADTHIAG
jgi:hypothetical protein